MRMADQRGRLAIEYQEKPKSVSDINHLSNRPDDRLDVIASVAIRETTKGDRQTYDAGAGALNFFASGARTSSRMREPGWEGVGAHSRSFTRARNMRDWTVPIGDWVTRAISSMEHPI